jgi:hypothetical protein
MPVRFNHVVAAELAQSNTTLARASASQVPFTLAFIEEKPVINVQVGLLPSCIVMRKSSKSDSTIKYEELAASRRYLASRDSSLPYAMPQHLVHD